MKLGFVTYGKANDIKNWSGTPYFMSRSFIENGIDVDFIDDLYSTTHDLFKIKSFYFHKIIGKDYQRFREPFILKSIAHKINKSLTNDIDAIFSPGSLEITYADTKKPIYFWSDAVFDGLLHFYPDYSNLNKSTIINGRKHEQLALEKSKGIFFSSDWAKETAKKFYNVDSNKIHVVPFGANIDTYPSYFEIKENLKNKNKNYLKILFVGLNWEKKGGDVLLRANSRINKLGIKTQVDIVGSKPNNLDNISGSIKFHGLLNKFKTDDYSILQKLYSEADLFILPSKAEAFGIVFCEANAFGLPVIAPNIGGIPTIIKNGINGFLVEQDEIESGIVEKTIQLWENKQLYGEIVLSSYNEFISRLNWKSSTKIVKEIIENDL